MTVQIEDNMTTRERAIRLADELDNVAEACRQTGISRTQFYVWRERFAREGRSGLRDRKPVAKNHPHHMSSDTERRIIGQALAHPHMGAHRLAALLKAKVDVHVHGVTVQRVLNRHGLRYREDRVARVEELVREGKVHTDRGLIEEIGRCDPKFRMFGQIGTVPSERLVIDSAIVGDFPETLSRLHVLLCIDTFSAFTWARLSSENTPEAMLDLLYQQVKPQLEPWGFELGTVELPFDPKFGKSTPPGKTRFDHVHMLKELFPFKYTVDHKLDGRRNGMVESFLEQIRKELFRPHFLAHPEHSEDPPRMQTMTQDWISSFNHRSLAGFPTWGYAPIRVVEEAREQMEKDTTSED